jgi:hypothetical protein
MIFARYQSQLFGLIKTILPFVLLLAGNITARAACNNQSIDSGDATGQVGVAFIYTITTSNGNPQTYSATGLPPGLSIPNPSNPTISGTPTVSGVYNVILTVTFTGNCTRTKPVTFTINPPNFVGFRLPDFSLGAGAPNNPRLMLQIGANGTNVTANRFNTTLEVDASGNETAWVPYNHFAGVTDVNPGYSFRDSWINDAALPVRQSLSSTGTPRAFGPSQLTTEVPAPAVYMKADPRATRFGIFQMDTNPTSNSRIVLSLWPSGSGTVPNGFGGTLGTDVEHVPNRFSGAAYYPATFSINGPPDIRNNSTTTYADNDDVTRPADAIYPGGASTAGASTPYYTFSTSYHPIILNRPFQNVAELGYAFRDLPWKTLDFFTDKSADAGLLDIFTINDGNQLVSGANDIVGMTSPTVVAGSVNLNTTQAADLQAVFAGAILDDQPPYTNQVSNTGTGPIDAPVLAANVVNATAATPMQNKSEIITRAGLSTAVLPTASNDNQAVKTRREVVSRAISSVSQTRVWNLVIDVVAQTGRFKPNATSLQNDFIVEGEQHYWVHVAIDRFTGRVIDKQIEVVNE